VAQQNYELQPLPLQADVLISVVSVISVVKVSTNDRESAAERHYERDHRGGHSGSPGPGSWFTRDSAYEACLAFELAKRGLKVEQQKPLPLIYEGVKLDCGYRIDLLVEGLIVVEVKSVDAVVPIHEAQVMSYLKLSGCKLALLINFNVRMLKDGIRRFVNGTI
jgi:GxxExxY protein